MEGACDRKAWDFKRERGIENSFGYRDSKVKFIIMEPAVPYYNFQHTSTFSPPTAYCTASFALEIFLSLSCFPLIPGLAFCSLIFHLHKISSIEENGSYIGWIRLARLLISTRNVVIAAPPV